MLIGPVSQLRAFDDAGCGTISALVPLPVKAPNFAEGDYAWVHINSGENILAHIHDVEVPVADDVEDDARETATNVS